MSIHITSAFIGSDYSELTLSGDAIEVSEMVHTIKSESGSTDDLTGMTINPAALAAMGGRFFSFFLVAKVGHTITIKQTSQIKTTDGKDFVMTETRPAHFLYDIVSDVFEGIGLVTTPSGNIVTETGVATLTNKNLTNPIINAPDLNEKIVSYASGAISTFYGIALLTGGSATTYTLADPMNISDDGQILRIMSTTAQAHKVDNSAGSGFNGGGGAVDFANFAGNAGDSIELLAYGGKWYVMRTTNVTIAGS